MPGLPTLTWNSALVGVPRASNRRARMSLVADVGALDQTTTNRPSGRIASGVPIWFVYWYPVVVAFTRNSAPDGRPSYV